MDFRLNMARMGQVTKQRNALLGLLVSTLVINALQVVERLTVSEKIILLPPDITRDVWIKRKEVSQGFIEEWTIYLSGLLLNVSANSIGYQRDLTLRNVSPESYSTIKSQFDQDKERLEKNSSSTTFMPSRVEVDTKGLTARITGMLSTYVGREKISEHKETYAATYKLQDWGRLQLKSFTQEGEETHDR